MEEVHFSPFPYKFSMEGGGYDGRKTEIIYKYPAFMKHSRIFFDKF